MGCVKTIRADRFPKQSKFVHWRAEVCFYYDTSAVVFGKIIRDDAEEPFETLIELDDGRVVRGCECQYAPFLPQKHGGAGRG